MKCFINNVYTNIYMIIRDYKSLLKSYIILKVISNFAFIWIYWNTYRWLCKIKIIMIIVKKKKKQKEENDLKLASI